MRSLLIRVVSAFVALVVLTVVYLQLGADGLRYICFSAPIIGVIEINRILFRPGDSKFLRTLFAFFVLAIFFSGVYSFPTVSLVFSVAAIVFCSSSIVYERRFPDLNMLSLFQAKSILGFFYVGLLPVMAVQVINLSNGVVWFFTLLGTVFAGDTFAYIFGLLWGKTKILPKISPKKTVMGSLGGLVGSVIAMAIASFYIPNIPMFPLLVLALFVGTLAQLGDLFESMLKRVADVKDSGKIMPGHGGILDRLDGVLFGAPILLAGASLLIQLYSGSS